MQIECHAELSGDRLAEWQAFLAQARHQHPRQDPRFADVERALGNDIIYATGRVGDTLRAVGLFSLRPHPFWPRAHAEALCLSGPVCDDAENFCDFLDGVMAHPAFSRTGRIRVTPYWLEEDADRLGAALGARGWRISEPEPYRETGWVDLRPEPEEILAGFSKSARREVRRAERQAIVLNTVKDEDGAIEFLESLNRLRTGRRLPAIPRGSFLAAFSGIYRFGDTGVIITACHGQEFVGGLLLYRGRDTAHGRHFTTETERLRTLGNLRLAPLVWFEGMKWARQHGCTALDVEGWRETADMSDRKYNIYKYKGEFRPLRKRRAAEHARTANFFVNMSGNAKDILKSALKKVLGLAGRNTA